MSHSFKKPQAEVLKLSFHGPNAETKRALFCFWKIIVEDMVYQGASDTVLLRSIDCLSYSKLFLNILAKKVHTHSALAYGSSKALNHAVERKIQDKAEKKDSNSIIPIPSKTKSSS